MKYLTTTCAIALATIAALGWTSSATAQGGGGSAVLPIFVDYDTPPPQIDQLTAAVDAVVVVRVEGARFESPVSAVTGRPRDVTRYDLRIVDVIKAYPMIGQASGVLEIVRLGGQHTENGRLVRSAVQGFEDFQTSAEYVLFLTWNKKTNEFDIAYGPNGSFQLTLGGTIRPLGRSALAANQQGKGRGAFLNELRNAAGRYMPSDQFDIRDCNRTS